MKRVLRDGGRVPAAENTALGEIRISVRHQEEPTIRNANTAVGSTALWIILITWIILGSGARASCADLVGKVLNNRGDPVSGVTVSVVNSQGVAAGRAVSDANGGYAISNLTPGAYKLGCCGDQWVMSYIGEQGLTVNWGLAPRSLPVAVARLGTAPDSTVTTSATPSKISHLQSKPETGHPEVGSGGNN